MINIHLSKKLKEPDWINQNYKNKMANIQTRECYRNVDFQKKTHSCDCL
ncbi:hypothetical protein HMP0015_2250 [Acinetobacter haemolyticus ATCC 19194]|uniref:Uncharacterized protein n=1 Tax=Acinetobacter haemolyticus ATCC 19194 TaxID=707232 RepID=D4XRA8_ACIHA|nr:hypothetical protein HMPREF0023_1929 [Acinetobacter sp. ATCC 27244]EFF82327.1 hypothetical protein HMP0015_2250 [Acinetobacter haemolyticus ATCC 19194]